MELILRTTLRFCISTLLVICVTACDSKAATTNTSSVHVAVERGLQYLQKEAYHWKETRKCAACHHAQTVIWTFNEAQARGYAVDQTALNEITEWAFGDMKTNSLTEQAAPRDVVNLGWVYTLLSVETASGLPKSSGQSASLAVNKPSSTNEDLIASARQTLLQQIVKKQVPDGSWGLPLDERVPLGGPVEDIAILSRLALLQSDDHSPTVNDCIDKAGKWLSANCDKTSRQGSNLRLLMNIWERRPAKELEAILASIQAEQNNDGGWSQTPEMESDAYATGQTLYVLARAGINPNVAAMKRGVEFLTRTQREEGSWPMTSRVHAKNLSPITGAGTQWAILGLLRASS